MCVPRKAEERREGGKLGFLTGMAGEVCRREVSGTVWALVSLRGSSSSLLSASSHGGVRAFLLVCKAQEGLRLVCAR